LPVKDKVIIYGTDECKFCHLAKKLSESKGMETEYIDIVTDIIGFNKLFPNCKTVPQIIIGGVHIGGYSSLKAYFENGAKTV